MEKSAILADLPSTRDERREGVVRECQNLRTALQSLLEEYHYLVGGVFSVLCKGVLKFFNG